MEAPNDTGQRRRLAVCWTGLFDPMRFVCFKAFAHADDVIDLKPNALVELNHLSVGGPNLKIDLRTPGSPQKLFCILHDLAAEAASLAVGAYRKVVDPSPMAFISHYTGGNNFSVKLPNEKPFGINSQFPFNIPFGVVVRHHEAACNPKGDYSFLIISAVRSYPQEAHLFVAERISCYPAGPAEHSPATGRTGPPGKTG